MSLRSQKMTNGRKQSTEDVNGNQLPPPGAAGENTVTNTGDHCQNQPADREGVTAREGVATRAIEHASGHGTNTVLANIPNVCPGHEPLSTEDASVIRAGFLECMDTIDINGNITHCEDATNLTKVPENIGNQADTSNGVVVNISQSVDINMTPNRIFPEELQSTSTRYMRRNLKNNEKRSYDLGVSMRRKANTMQVNAHLPPQRHGATASESPNFRRRLDFSSPDSQRARPRLEDPITANNETPENARGGSHSQSLKRSKDTSASADTVQESKRVCTKQPSPERTETGSKMHGASTPANAKKMSDQTPTQNKASPSSQDNGPEIETSKSSFQVSHTAPQSLDIPGRAVQKERQESGGSVSPSAEQIASHQDAKACSPVQENWHLQFVDAPDIWTNLRLDDCNFVYKMRNVRFFARLLEMYGCGIESLTVSSLMPTLDWKVKHIVGLVPRFCFNIKELVVDFPDMTENALWRIAVANKLDKLNIRRMFVSNFESLVRCIMPLEDLKELEIHLGDEIEVDLERHSSDLIMDLGLFFRRNSQLTTLKLFFTVTTGMVRSILKHCRSLTHLELDVRVARGHLTQAAFGVPHDKLGTLILRSIDLCISDIWLYVIRNSFPALSSMEVAGRHTVVTRRRSGTSGALCVTSVIVY